MKNWGVVDEKLKADDESLSRIVLSRWNTSLAFKTTTCQQPFRYDNHLPLLYKESLILPSLEPVDSSKDSILSNYIAPSNRLNREAISLTQNHLLTQLSPTKATMRLNPLTKQSYQTPPTILPPHPQHRYNAALALLFNRCFTATMSVCLLGLTAKYISVEGKIDTGVPARLSYYIACVWGYLLCGSTRRS